MIVLTLFLLAVLSPSRADPMEPLEEMIEKKQYGAALQHLAKIEQTFPREYLRNNLVYLKAVLLGRLGKPEEANVLLEQLVRADFLLRDNALLHLIENLKGQPLSTRKPYLEDFLSGHASHPRWAATALDYARLLEEGGHYANAKLWYDRVWHSKQGTWSRQAALGHALLHLKTGEESEALRDIKKLIQKDDKDDVAYRAVQQWERLQSVESLAERDAAMAARVSMNNRDAESARRYLRHLIDTFPASSNRDKYGYMMGRSHVIEDSFRKGVEGYERTAGLFPNSRWGIFCKYLAANTALRDRSYQEAAQRYRAFIRLHPDSIYTDRAFFNLIDTLLWLGKWEESEKTAKQALALASGKRQRPFHYALVRLYLEKEDNLQALEHLEQLDHLTSSQLPPGVTREEIYYWKGICLKRLGRSSESARAFYQAFDGSPNYFAYLSRDQLSPEASRTESPRESWRGRLILPRRLQANPGNTSASAIADRPARIRELLFLRLYDEAALEIQNVSSKLWGINATTRLFNLAFYAAKGDLAGISTHAAYRLQRSAHLKPQEYPEELAHLLYPRHYWEIVNQYAQSLQVEPELILSVIRRESAFQADAKSPASARGLMQFILPIARDVAREMGLPEPEEEHLYRPELSIQLGTYQLRRQLDRFDGSVEKALAAYNGAPENVERWMSKLRDPDDAPLFVTNIGFRETKLYVLKVLGDYHSYRTLYGSRGDQQALTPQAETLPGQTRTWDSREPHVSNRKPVE